MPSSCSLVACIHGDNEKPDHSREQLPTDDGPSTCPSHRALDVFGEQ